MNTHFVRIAESRGTIGVPGISATDAAKYPSPAD